ncbi:hypothetical protein, partial [Bradyrhizobium sp.]|uniref:hypothetical protein n=1 Tax=Bradyrhizobium sp. TaxID=376 RepID=UPI00391CDF0C
PLPRISIVARRWGRHPVHHQLRWLWGPGFRQDDIGECGAIDDPAKATRRTTPRRPQCARFGLPIASPIFYGEPFGSHAANSINP